MSNQAYFITSTGTEIGKTFITTKLIQQRKAAGLPVHAIKPVISGWQDEGTDTHLLLDALDQPINPHTIDALSPWRYNAPLSPDMAARQEGNPVEEQSLLNFCQQQIQANEFLFIEGVGGVMVPINDHFTVLDWIKALNIEAILITGTYLGSISHCLTSYTVLKQHNIPIKTVIINESEEKPAISAEETYKTLQSFIDSSLEVVHWEVVL